MGDKLHRREGNNPDRPLRSQSRTQCERKLDSRDSQDVGLDTEAVGSSNTTVGERCVRGEEVRTTSLGAHASDYAGMSRR